MLGELKGSSWVQLVKSAREVKVRERKGEEAKGERQQCHWEEGKGSESLGEVKSLLATFSWWGTEKAESWNQLALSFT